MAKKKPNKTIQQYNRIRSQLNRQIRGMEKRGYFFEKPQVPAKPKKITAASVRRLKKIKSELYEKARFRTPEGTVTSGKRGRYLERAKAGRRAAETRQARRQPIDYEAVAAEDVIYDRLWNIVEEIMARHPAAGHYLSQQISKELNFAGPEPEEQKRQQIRICRQLEGAGTSHIETLAVIAYYRSGTDAGHQAFNELMLILSGGEIPTAEEMAERSAVFYEDEDGMLQLYDDLEPLPFD